MRQIIIIGAGPAGLIAGMQLKKLGYHVIILEKNSFPRFVIGESLLPACMAVLDDLDLIDELKSANHQVKTGASFCRGDETCEFLFEDQFYEGWGWTWQVKRSDFDQHLFDIAVSRGLDIRLACEVIQVSTSSDKQEVIYRQNDKEVKLTGAFILDASGYGRVLPRLLGLESESDLPNRNAVFSHIKDVNRTIKNGENIFVHSFNNNKDWIWVIPFNDETASIGVVGSPETTDALVSEKDFLNFFQSFKDLNSRFVGQDLKRDIQTIKGYSVKAESLHGEGFALCGNSTEFLDPIFSSGVTFALISGKLAADLLHKQLEGETVDWQTEYDDYLRFGLDVFKDFIKMWYDGTFQRVAFAKYVQPSIKQQICSVLAGYVWDESNPFVSKREKVLKNLLRVIEFAEQEK